MVDVAYGYSLKELPQVKMPSSPEEFPYRDMIQPPVWEPPSPCDPGERIRKRVPLCPNAAKNCF